MSDDEAMPPAAPPVMLASHGVWRPGQRTLTTGIVLIITLVASEALAVATVLPAVERELGDLGLYGWVFSAFFLGNLIGVVVAGRMADRFAPVVPFAIGLALFIVGLIGAGGAQSMLGLVLARGLQGLGAGALPAVAYVCIGRAYSADERPRMFAVLSTAWVLPAAIGPGLAGFVGDHLSWRWVFLGLLPLVVVAGGMSMWSLRRLAEPAVTPAGAAGGRIGAVARPPIWVVFVLATAAAVVISALDDITSIRSVAVLIAGATVMVVAFRRLTPPGTLRAARGVPATVACMGLVAFAFFSADAFVPLALTEVRGTSVAFAGAVITAVTLGWTAGSWLQDHRIRRIGPRPLVGVGLGSVTLGTVGMIVVLSPAVPVGFAFVAWTVGGLGAGFTFGPLSAAMLAAAPSGAEGETTASFQLSEVLGVALGTGVAGAIVAVGKEAGWTIASAVTAVFVMAAAVAAVGLLTVRRLPPSVLTDGREPTASTERLSGEAVA